MNRTDDMFPYQKSDGTWGIQRSKLGDDIIAKHLEHKITIGLYSSVTSTTKWLCIDIDTLEMNVLTQTINKLKSLGLPVNLEFSGSKGYHFWIFFTEIQPNHLARKLGKLITVNHEVFPKQDTTSTEYPGNLVKAPLGIHQVSKRECVFVDEQLQPYPDQLALLHKMQKVDLVQTLSRLNVNSDQYAKKNSVYKNNKSSQLRPCVLEVLRNGTKCGQRNIVAHIVACEFRNYGYSREKTLGILLAWNWQNESELTISEINNILYGVYNNHYIYSCQGKISQYLDCSKNQCQYYTQNYSRSKKHNLKE
ncbi:MAG: hypothetical protein WC955_05020 [Elusimicrobiota bacterium]